MRSHRVGAIAIAVVVVVGLTGGTAYAQVSTSATVTRVNDGHTLDARLADGRDLSVRLIGIDGPDPGPPEECGAEDATAALRQLVEGQAVSLVSDPFQPALDSAGHSLFYVDRAADGVDAGGQIIALGLARIDPDETFQRDATYRVAQRDARDAGDGLWSDCDGDFHRTHADELRDRRLSAAGFVRSYYAAVSGGHFADAWDSLGRPVRRKLGSFDQWRAGHRRSLGVSVTSTSVRLSGSRAVVSVSVRARDRDACTGRVVRQLFRGRWVLAPRDGSWVAVGLHIRKTGGGRVRLSKSECPPPPKPPSSGPPSAQCEPGYSPCIAPGSDVDCAGGSGNGPRYVDGPVRVTGGDPYGLDSDGDGYGCEP
ncbi:MAG TPA: thermonuclease family protein [Thermoleophilaceae bacterium]|nr:thermonuclease family protein [Thermoleophilaceae bacterium]